MCQWHETDVWLLLLIYLVIRVKEPYTGLVAGHGGSGSHDVCIVVEDYELRSEPRRQRRRPFMYALMSLVH